MAGIFDFLDPSRPGKGISKNEPLKNRFFLFFELYFRNFWRLLRLNVVFTIACIPIVTFGPAVTALLKVTSDIVERKSVFVWNDFWKAFGKNFKSSFLWGILEIFMTVAVVYANAFCVNNLDKGILMVVGFFVTAIFAILFLFMFFHSWLLSAKVELSGFATLKNSLILATMSIKANIILFVFVAILVLLGILTIPYFIVLLPFFPMATLGFAISYLYFPYIYVHIIKPYYDQNGLEDPYARKEEEDDEYEYEYVYEDEQGNVIETVSESRLDENLFSDAVELESKQKKASTEAKQSSKTIR